MGTCSVSVKLNFKDLVLIKDVTISLIILKFIAH